MPLHHNLANLLPVTLLQACEHVSVALLNVNLQQINSVNIVFANYFRECSQLAGVVFSEQVFFDHLIQICVRQQSLIRVWRHCFQPVPDTPAEFLNAHTFGAGSGKPRQRGSIWVIGKNRAIFTYYPNAPALSGLATAGAERVSVKELSRSVRNWLKTVAPDADQTLLPDADLDQMVEKYLLTEDYTCELRTLSEIIRENNIDRIDLLKIDVEKSDADVLAGLEESDWKKIRQVVMEGHSKELYDHFAPILEKHGFNL